MLSLSLLLDANTHETMKKIPKKSVSEHTQKNKVVLKSFLNKEHNINDLLDMLISDKKIDPIVK